MENITLGYAFCGSFCTMKQSVEALRELSKFNIKIKPIMSQIVYGTNTRFGKANDFIKEVEDICHEKIIHTIDGAKTALGITDTPVTMAVKAHLRNEKPVVLAIATNDALGASAKNIGLLHNTKNIYFVPYSQDDPISKHYSLVCNFSLIPQTVENALKGIQIEPVLVGR